MVYQTVWEWTTANNATGIGGILSYASNVVPIFTPMLLFCFFLIITMGSYFSQIRLRGYGDFWASFTVGGTLTTVVSMVMYMITPPIINLSYVVICFAITLVGVVILFVSNER